MSKTTIEHYFRYAACAVLLGLVSVVTGGRLRAQAFSDWKEGTVVLASGDTLSGRMFLNLDSDLLEVEYHNAIKTYTAYQVILVRFYEPERLFTSHTVALRGTMEVPSFFEVLYPGAFATLLSRDRLGQNNAPIVDQYGQAIGSFYGKQNYRRDFFVLNARGRVRRMPGRRQELAEFLEKDPPEALREYVKKHRPDPSSDEDMVALIAFYNHFKSGQPGMLR